MSLKIYLDGKFVPEEEAKISVFDHGLLYGDGVFEGIRAYNGRVFKLKEHIDRLYDGLHALMITPAESKEEMIKVVTETCKINDFSDCYIRLVVTRGVGDLGLNPIKCIKSSTFCIAAQIAIYSREVYENGLEMATVPTRRNHNESCNVRVKSLNYLNNIYARIEANLIGVPEAVFLNSEGYVSEATADNIFIIKNGVITTPPLSVGTLGGISRQTVMDLARAKGYEVNEALFTRYDVYTADECFVTGTAAELVPAVKYDARVIGTGKPGPIFNDLLATFKEYAKKPESGEPIL